MCERRVLILAVVTDIHDSAVTYPSCCGCYSKLLVDPTTERYHCIRCGISCDRSKVQWRYRLVLSVADGATIGKIVVFGRTLDGFFGKTATDFSRSLDDLEQTGYPASSMLSEALLRTFHGKYFYFGFKLTGSTYTEETPALKHVLKSDHSLCYSQLDSTSNFENSHTLAYQMLACSDAVYATVTDHMRLFVKHLRNKNHSKMFEETESNQSRKVCKEIHSIKNVSCGNVGSGSSCRTVSFGANQESLRFSFETENQSISFEGIERLNRSKSNLPLHDKHVTKLSENGESPLATYKDDSKDKEYLLAGSRAETENMPNCVTSSTIHEDEASCFPLMEIGNEALSILQAENQIFIIDGRFASSFISSNTDTFSDSLVAHRLDFDTFNENKASNTSTKIDNELIRRKLTSSQKNVFCKTAPSFRLMRALGTKSCIGENRQKTGCGYSYNGEDLMGITVESSCNDAERSHNELNNFGDAPDEIVDSCLKRKQGCNIIDKLKMPESEDLDEFFKSQFEGIEFTQDIASVENNTTEKDGHEQFSDLCSNARKVNKETSKDIGDENLYLDTPDIMMDINSEKINSKQCLVMTRVDGINLKKEITTVFLHLPESEGIEDFLDSFEECLLQEEDLTAQSVVKVITDTGNAKLDVDEKENKLDEYVELDKVSSERKGENAMSENIAEKCRDLKGENENETHVLKDKIVDDSQIDRKSDILEKGEYILTLPFFENDNEGTGYDTDVNESEEINESKFDLDDSVYSNTRVDLQRKSSITFDSFTRPNKNGSDKCIKAQNKLVPEEHELTDTYSAAERMSDGAENESSELEQFFADISNCKRTKVKDDMFRPGDSSTKNKQTHKLDREHCEEKRRTNIIKSDSKKNCEDLERDLEEVYGLSQLSLKEAGISNEKRSCEAGNSTLDLVIEGSTETLSSVTNDICTDKEINQNEEDCSIIDSSSDFEETKATISKMKPAFRLVPFSRFFSLGKKSQKTVEDFRILKHGKSETVNGSNHAETEVTSSGVNDCDSGYKLKSLVRNLETLTEKGECTNTKYESNSINHSADLFEMSVEETEQNSAYVLTVCTPSFNSQLCSENSDLSENIFEDSPLGTSTPGLDECVIFDSQNISCINESQTENKFGNQGDGKRKVKFDKRLRRVSSCHVMDIRMRINESPLNVPGKAVKSCLKSRKLPKKNEQSVIQESTNNSRKPEVTANYVEKQISENLCGHTATGSFLNGNITWLDGSVDLFDESFNISAEKPIVVKLKDDKPKTVGKTVGTCDSEKHVIGDDQNKTTPHMSNSMDLWLNESSDLFMYDVPDVSQNEHSVRNSNVTSCKQNLIPDNVLDKSENVAVSSFITVNSETPDLFSSQESFKNLISTKVSESPCSKMFRLPENQINKGIPLQLVGGTLDCSKRKVFKCLVINTPDCDTDNLSKHRSVLSKYQNQSPGVGEEIKGSGNEMKENVSAYDSPDIFGDSLEEFDRKIVCDKKIAVISKNSVLCKKLFF